MTATANWSYTAKATYWRKLGEDEYGDSLGFAEPIVIDCDYEGGLSSRLGDIGKELTASNTFWTEFSEAKRGDYLFIGESTEPDPIKAGADEVMRSIRYADTFDRIADDWAIITGV